MQTHDYFEELAALGAAGLLSGEEYRELQQHLDSCHACSHASDEFDFILSEIPQPEPSAGDTALQRLQGDSYRQRFLTKATAEGVHFSRQALGEQEKRVVLKTFQWRPFVYGATAAIATLLVILSVVVEKYLPLMHGYSTTLTVPPPTLVRAAPAQQEDAAAGVIVELQRRNGEALAQLIQLRQALARETAEKEKLENEVANSKTHLGTLDASNRLLQQQLSDAGDRFQRVDRQNSELTASLVAQQVKIRDLYEQVKLRTEAVEREKQLTAAARDVRELMGARSLHIVDVADLNEQGKPKKSFGRVFYTEGKSLIFYAFDLSQKGSATKVTFQAWGQGNGKEVNNLGVFHIDDQEQKRWVLRVDNPKLLDSVISVFVTVEPSPGRDKPSGKKLLYAYLGTQANHP